MPHSARATTRAFGNADRLSPDPAYPNSAAFSGVSGMSTSKPSIARTRHARSHAPRVSAVATGCTTDSKISAITGAPNRTRAWVIPDDDGTCQRASQHPNRVNAPVTFVATSS